MSRTRQSMRKKRNTANGIGCFLLLLILGGLVFGGQFVSAKYIAKAIGPMNEDLGPFARFTYPVKLLLEIKDLLQPTVDIQEEYLFTVSAGQSPYEIAAYLKEDGMINSAQAMIDYLIYSGKDTAIQQGEFKLDRNMNVLQIVDALMDPLPTKGRLVILPGWRLEEIAEALPTTGIEVTPEQFLSVAKTARIWSEFEPTSVGAEGFILPGDHMIDRKLTAEGLVTYLLEDSQASISPDLTTAFADHGLTVYQAFILASLIEKETVVLDEMPMIASVFYNRLDSAMMLQTDPTVQYALGKQSDGSWWKVPLSAADLEVSSPFNTYLVYGLPPSPIATPSMDALWAVAFPEETDHYFFRSECDNSGWHTFSVTYAEHLEKACP